MSDEADKADEKPSLAGGSLSCWSRARRHLAYACGSGIDIDSALADCRRVLGRQRTGQPLPSALLPTPPEPRGLRVCAMVTLRALATFFQ